mmetsp:Transcript_10708/g.18997  ORF Transcript_10708/g.18997 Transcript_10708/m.18997 type:complete len:223 (+) Transcript_10708:602-1270(+)
MRDGGRCNSRAPRGSWPSSACDLSDVAVRVGRRVLPIIRRGSRGRRGRTFLGRGGGAGRRHPGERCSRLWRCGRWVVIRRGLRPLGMRPRRLRWRGAPDPPPPPYHQQPVPLRRPPQPLRQSRLHPDEPPCRHRRRRGGGAPAYDDPHDDPRVPCRQHFPPCGHPRRHRRGRFRGRLRLPPLPRRLPWQPPPPPHPHPMRPVPDQSYHGAPHHNPLKWPVDL